MQYEKILNHIHAGVLYCKNDQYSTILWANDYFYKMIGYTKEEMENEYQNRFSVHVIDDVSSILKDIEKKIKNNEDLDFEYRMRKKDGSVIWIHDTAKYDKETDCWYVTIMDITDMKTINYERERLELYLNSIPNKVIIIDEKGNIIYKNKEVKSCPYYDQSINHIKPLLKDYILGYTFEDIVQLAKSKNKIIFETRFKKDGHIIGHDINRFVQITSTDKKGINYMLISESLIKLTDDLSLFPSRLMFERYYNTLVRKTNQILALAIVDIDDFKQINDKFGHDIGDDAIRFTSKTIMEVLEHDDYACRYGGDEFLLLLCANNESEIRKRLELILASTSQSHCFHNQEIKISYSIGCAITNHILDFKEAFKEADQALYLVKENGKSHLGFK